MKKYRTVYRSILLSALVAMLLGGTASPAFAASLTPLGDLPGGIFNSFAWDVSADGSTVVGVSETAAGNEAFRWTASSGMVGLGGLGYGGGTFVSHAYGVSADGSVVVGAGSIAGDSGEAFRWTAASGMVGLGNFSGDLRYGSYAAAVNSDGSVVVGGGSFLLAGTVYSEAFRWTAASGMVGLGDLPGGNWSTAKDVSADGSTIVGDSNSVNATSEAFRWTAASGMVGLGDLPGGDFQSHAYSVSADGSTVVGYSSSSSSAADYEAFRWTEASGMVGLGHLGIGDSYAFGVSADGSTVVGYSGGAVRWTSAGGMEPLWDLLLANDIDPAADGWTALLRATGVSADGNTIVGFGIRNGNIEAFVAVVPEPGGLSLIGLAVLALLRRRKRVYNATVK